MAKSVKLKEADTFLDTEGIRDFEQGKTQAEINAELIKANTYSTEETLIGTWLGEPLYRKVIAHKFDVTIGSKTEYKEYTIPLGVAAKEVVSLKTFNSNKYFFPHVINGGYTQAGKIVDNQIVLQVMGDTWNAAQTWYFVVEYTKA